MSISKRKTVCLITAIVFWGGLFIYFRCFNPLYLSQTDDWAYITYTRLPVPLAGYWNPTKVYPETMMPLVSQIGVSIYLLFDSIDYIDALALSHAIFLSFVITVYLLMFLRVLIEVVHLNEITSAMLTLIVLLLHFCFFNSDTFLFRTDCVNSYFNYLIPTLTNAILVMKLIVWHCRKTKLSPISYGLLILTAYLSINSNMFSNVVLASFVGVSILFALLQTIYRKDSFIDLLKHQSINLIILSAWLVSVCLEAGGGRAAVANRSVTAELKTSIYDYLESLKSINPSFYIVFVICILMVLSINFNKSIRTRDINNEINEMAIYLAKFFISAIITVLYLILLCAASCFYIKRPAVMMTWVFWFILIFVFSFGFFFRMCSQSQIVLPLAIYILLSITVISPTRYKHVGDKTSPLVSKAICDDIVLQVLTAEQEGMTEVDVHVPVYYSDDNWPYAIYAGDYISNALYLHHVTDKRIEVTLIPDEEYNIKYQLPLIQE